jgi:hypothetical protein
MDNNETAKFKNELTTAQEQQIDTTTPIEQVQIPQVDVWAMLGEQSGGLVKSNEDLQLYIKAKEEREQLAQERDIYAAKVLEYERTAVTDPVAIKLNQLRLAGSTEQETLDVEKVNEAHLIKMYIKSTNKNYDDSEVNEEFNEIYDQKESRERKKLIAIAKSYINNQKIATETPETFKKSEAQKAVEQERLRVQAETKGALAANWNNNLNAEINDKKYDKVKFGNIEFDVEPQERNALLERVRNAAIEQGLNPDSTGKKFVDETFATYVIASNPVERFKEIEQLFASQNLEMQKKVEEARLLGYNEALEKFSGAPVIVNQAPSERSISYEEYKRQLLEASKNRI